MPNNRNSTGLAGLAFLLLSCSTPGIFSNNNNNNNSSNGATSVENVSFTQQDEAVHITYDLLSSTEGMRYSVRLFLDLEEEGRYLVDSESVFGDIGSNIAPGRDKEIVWEVLQDFPQGLEREQIQFALNVQPERGSNRNWVYIAGAAVALGAGVSAAMMIMGSGDSGSTGLPSPPSRPPGMQ